MPKSGQDDEFQQQPLSDQHKLDCEFIEAARLQAFGGDLSSGSDLASTVDPLIDTELEFDGQEAMPKQLGRFLIQRRLGQGAFGVVYLAHDPQLDRAVALKVPRRNRFKTLDQVDSFIQEARTAAKLKHPLLVAVYDVQQVDRLPCIVQEYVDGQNLATWAAGNRPAMDQIVKVLMSVAEALGHAHKQRMTHCDLKLANVLMDQEGLPHVADFGLAVHDNLRLDRAGERFGTPYAMAPEQVRGEGHRLDGRTDIWAMGIMMYELLVGQKPFIADNYDELFHMIELLDPRPLRQIEPRVPRELERICLKCLSKRKAERFETADDLRQDLALWLAQYSSSAMVQPTANVASAANVVDSHASSQPRFKVVPKGLRSFDTGDADFFLELLPGPRDRDGLPESIRFWKNQIEATNADETFSVGLIYGPSGCGKSSFVKAGLLPRLADSVLPIYLEATAVDTEARLIKQLHKVVPPTSASNCLVDVCAEIRRTGIGRNRKLVIIIDQFEQWLHAHLCFKQQPLVDSLRQCDGSQMQAILLVRDDFSARVHLLFQELEIPLLEGNNYALVSRFDENHARKVLTLFGQAYGKWDTELTVEQKEFLNKVIDASSEDGMVIGVRVALFADMMKSRPWIPASLKEVGGVGGVGVRFLETTFSDKSAPPSHLGHAQAIRQVLAALLPEAGTDIKGGMQSERALCEASGYQEGSPRFVELKQILDSELRIITPTELEADDFGDEATESAGKYYQLTHDYLVPSLRTWLTLEKVKTRAGRTQLKLEERAAQWNAKHEKRYLPSLWEFLGIIAWTDRYRWTDVQRKMMAGARRLHGFRSAIGLLALTVFICVGIVLHTNIARRQEETRLEGLVHSLVRAEPSQLPEIIHQLEANPEVAEIFLSPLLSRKPETVAEKRAQLHASLAAVSHDASLVEPLVEELLTGPMPYVLPIRAQLRSYAAQLTEQFRTIFRNEKSDAQRRLRAALALVDYAPASEAAAWTEQELKFVTEQLVSSNAEFQPLLRDLLRPIREQLLPELERVFAEQTAHDSLRLSAANALADYSRHNLAKLSQLMLLATPEQFDVLYPNVAAAALPDTLQELASIAENLPTEDLDSVERIAFGQRRANAAVSLLRLGEREKALQVCKMTDDPEALTQFIFRCRPRKVGVDALLDCLQLVSQAPRSYSENSRYALLLALGEFTLDEVPQSRGGPLIEQLAEWYAQDPSSGVHAATGWLLRRWGQTDRARQILQTEVAYSPDREWFTLAITVTPTAAPSPKAEPASQNAEAGGGQPALNESHAEQPVEQGAEARKPSSRDDVASEDALPSNITAREAAPGKTFYYTYIVFPAGEYTVGPQLDESGRQDREETRLVELTHPFAMLDREITFDELIAFAPDYEKIMKQFHAQPEDAGFGADWYNAVAFCRWLGLRSGLGEEDQAYAAPKLLDEETYPRDQAANWAPRDWPIEIGRPGFRLPTEVEWEVAVRAGCRTAFEYGSDAELLRHFGWYMENSGKRGHPPCELRPSLRGLFDLHGNLWEWNHDWFEEDLSQVATDSLGPEAGSARVLRGGSWSFDAAGCRSARRHADLPATRTNIFGVRPALSLDGNQSR